jgi:hypothetical protein
MKTYTIVTYLFVCLMLASCSTEKRLQRAANKHGQRESIAFLFQKYRDYLPTVDTTPLPLILRDTVVVVVPADTLTDDSVTILIDSTATLENGQLKVLVKRLSQNVFRLQAQLKEKADTVYVKQKVFVPTPVQTVPCPDEKTLWQKSGNKVIWALFGLGFAAYGTWLLLNRLLGGKRKT